MSIRATLAAAVVLWILLAHTAAGVSVVLNPVDPVGSGSNDFVWGIERLQSVQTAADTWGALLAESYPGQTITLDIAIAPTAPGTSMHGNATTDRLFQFPASSTVPPKTWVTPALAGHLAGFDVETVNAEGRIDFTGPSDQLSRGLDFDFFHDFERLALHEIGHVLGFGSSLLSDGTYFPSNRPDGTVEWPHLFDTFLVASDGTRLVDMTEQQRAAAYESGAVFWSGAQATAANGGVMPSILATGGEADTNLDHFDATIHAEALMTPFAGLASDNPAPTTLDLAVLRDLGWDTNGLSALGGEFAVSPSPNAFLTGIGLTLLIALRRKRREPR